MNFVFFLQQKLVVKPDQLIKRRGKLGLVKVLYIITTKKDLQCTRKKMNHVLSLKSTMICIQYMAHTFDCVPVDLNVYTTIELAPILLLLR